jgi:hypothetical protein
MPSKSIRDALATFGDALTGAYATKQILFSLSMMDAQGYRGSGVETDMPVCNPRFDRALYEVVGLVHYADILPVVNHPTKLDRGEVGGEQEACPAPDKPN